MKILAVSGSLRAASSNRALLQAAAQLAPVGVEVELFEGIAELPHFNPDRDATGGPAVTAWRQAVAVADAMLLSCPEYARGIPGAFKNALDWLVSGSEFPQMPVALINASPRSSRAQDSLRCVLQTMSARLVEEACAELPLLGRGLDAQGIAEVAEFAAILRASLQALAAVGPRQRLCRPL